MPAGTVYVNSKDCHAVVKGAVADRVVDELDRPRSCESTKPRAGFVTSEDDAK
jgi:hypothetical protein